jgi:hypothetical protein
MSGDNTRTGYTALAQGDCSGAGTAAAVTTATTDRVEVVAPADLPGSYELPCDLLGRPVVVRVVSAFLGGSARFSLVRVPLLARG